MPNHTAVCPSSSSTREQIVGIWRLGQRFAQGCGSELSLAQPADSRGNPRFDYVLKSVRQPAPEASVGLPAPQDTREAQRRIMQSIEVAGVTHPNLIAVLDASDASHAPYLVMPRLDTVTMDERIRQIEHFALPVALWWTRQVAQALEKLHSAGWVHGNVTPGNVLVDAKGHATLIDLGFSARIHTPLHRTFRGTPNYASPELATGGTAALPAMDTFALGRLLWGNLAATAPVAPAVIEPVAELIERMVADDPQQRPAIGEVVQRLLALEIDTLGEHIGPVLPARAIAA
ncbi:protein kinase family protein [Allorhodopirellula solitaria]|uniref:Serine/threonine-protein kinase PrkC n=1 Tax=Allorhodopirellula solitaria TaxID=2527987 RepID=A0A5C5YJ57_9BACT|nr:protein kinase family protein [Allorhodopirellula solitaria]TWT74903.1 Serine/threonine-protein kinase PrkC [Allorhodopirellula solitaria]